MVTSPLRYPGGKSKLFPFISKLIKENNYFDHEYCEPYAGGAGLAIRLLANGFVEQVKINDIDNSIYAFWCAALQHTDEFCSMIENTPVTIDEWHKQKEIWQMSDRKDKLSLGFATYFLNRTNRSGIISGAGPIGGYSQSGNWKIDARLNKSRQIENLISLSKFASQIVVTNFDALKFFRRVARNEKSFIYLDPPYYAKGPKLYTNFYEPQDHKQISDELALHRKSKWIVSYDDVSEIRNLYEDFKPITYNLSYSAGEKTVGSEVIFHSDVVKIPKHEGFRVAA